MKRVLVLLLTVVITVALVNAQGLIKEGNIYFGDKTSSAWIAPAKSDLEMVKKNLVKYTKKNLGLSLKSEGKDLLKATEVTASTIAGKRGDLVVKLFDDNGTATIGVAFMMGYEISLNTREYPTEMGNLKNFTTDFLKYHYKSFHEYVIDTDSKRISQINKEIKKNDRTMNSLGKMITEGEDQIAAGPGPEESLKINNKIIDSKSKRESLMAINLNLKNEITRLEYNIGVNTNAMNSVDVLKF